MAFLYVVGSVLMHKGTDPTRTLTVTTKQDDVTTKTHTSIVPQRLFVAAQRNIGGGDEASNIYRLRGVKEDGNVQRVDAELLELFEHELTPYLVE